MQSKKTSYNNFKFILMSIIRLKGFLQMNKKFLPVENQKTVISDIEMV